jgi:phospholipase/carboxylesterase
MVTLGEESLHGVVQRTNTGGQPQGHRSRECQLGVIDHRVEQEPYVASPRFVAGLIRISGAPGELSHRKRRWNGDVGKATICKPAPVRELDRNDLGGVDGAAAAEADQAIDNGLSRRFNSGLDLGHRRVLADHHRGWSFRFAHRASDTSDHVAFINEGPCGDKRDTVRLQTLQLWRQLDERSWTPVNGTRVGVVENAGHRAVIVSTVSGPHQGQPVLDSGEPLATARAAMILVHGRGASAADIMTLGAELMHPGVAYLAPQAAGNAWYPNPFTAPMESNEPYLTSALEVLSSLFAKVEKSVAGGQIILLGFSQGACLALEFAARHARRYGGVVGLSGGLIGPDGTPRDYPSAFDGTSVFLGCSDVDPHIRKDRVLEAADVFTRMGAKVTARLYPQMGHTVNADEIQAVREIVAATAS